MRRFHFLPASACSPRRPGRSPQRRQIDAVQCADAHPRCAGPRPARRHPRPQLRRLPPGSTTRPFVLVDTGGIAGEDEGLAGATARQARAAAEEADLVLFVVDGREGASTLDDDILALAAQDRAPDVPGGQQDRRPRRARPRSPNSRATASTTCSACRPRIAQGIDELLARGAGARCRRTATPRSSTTIRSACASPSSAAPTSASRRWSTACSARNA